MRRPAGLLRTAAASFLPVIKVGLISLGCAKNLVDSEVMVGHLRRAGMEVVPDLARADVVIINTCSFIGDAKEESIQAILEAGRMRGRRGRSSGRKLIVAGCMAQRSSRELAAEMPEVDAFMGLDQVADVADIVGEVCAAGRPPGGPAPSFVTPRSRWIPDYDTPRYRLTPRHFAYLKIAEGCNHPCSFCIIPQIRGRHRSRTVESVVAEARRLVAAGVREINLISQDTTCFGMDRWERRAGPRTPVDSSRGECLATLLRALDAIEGDFWVRVLYTHPAHWSDELIRAIAECPKVARYVDMPLQHISDRMLQRMRRETPAGHIRDLIARIRAGIPGITLRTTFIVGFPGETEDDFEELCGFIREARFERLGVFRYSQEEGTRAASMGGQVSAAVKERRWRRVMALQRGIALAHNRACVGRTFRVLVEGPGVARSEADAPEIDGSVRVPAALPAGEFATVLVTGAREYDLLALPPGRRPPAPRPPRPAG